MPPHSGSSSAGPADPLVWAPLYAAAPPHFWGCLITLYCIAFLSWLLSSSKSRQSWERTALRAPTAVLAPVRVLYLLGQLRALPFPLPAWAHASLNSLPTGCSIFLSIFCHGRTKTDDDWRLCLWPLFWAALHVCGLGFVFHSVYTQAMLPTTKGWVAFAGTYWQIGILAHCAQECASVAAVEWTRAVESVALRETLSRFGVAEAGASLRRPSIGLRLVVVVQLCCLAVQITCCFVSYHAPRTFRSTFTLAQGSFLMAELLFVVGALSLNPADITSWAVGPRQRRSRGALRAPLLRVAARQLAASRRPGWQGGSVPPGVPPRPGRMSADEQLHLAQRRRAGLRSRLSGDGSDPLLLGPGELPPPHAPPDGCLAARAA